MSNVTVKTSVTHIGVPPSVMGDSASGKSSVRCVFDL